MRKLRLSEVGNIPGHPASVWQSWAFDPSAGHPDPVFFPLLSRGGEDRKEVGRGGLGELG